MFSNRLQMIFTQEEIDRLSIKEHTRKETQIIADVHGIKFYQAKHFINNIFNTMHSAFKLVIIHGYNHETAIKDMLSVNFINSHITDQYVDPYNQGVTHMLIAA